MDEAKNSEEQLQTQISKYNFELLKQIISDKTGIRIIKNNQQFEPVILERMKCLNFLTPVEYELFLNIVTPESAAEIRTLRLLLTSNETYFFRDPELFSLLKNRIFPELIKQQKEKKVLRLWSAGCSSGEEAYSLAILLTQIMPEYFDWKISIFASDINTAAIEYAKCGTYGQWSFRNKDNFQAKYFEVIEDKWQLKEQFRKLVQFQELDLIKDNFPNAQINNMHLILCRNVLLYFNHDAIAQVMAKFTNTLCENGCLVTGHGELFGQTFDKRLSLKIFPETIIYNKKITKPVQSTKEQKKQPLINTASTAAKSLDSEKNLSDAQKLFDHGDYQGAIFAAQQYSNIKQCAYQAHCLIALAYANLGDYENACKYCNDAINLNPLETKPYYLLVQIAELQMNYEQAKKLLKKIIYLNPNFVAAYIDLANIYKRQNRSTKAHESQLTAIKILQSLPPKQLVAPYDISAAELLEHITSNLL